LLLLAVLAGCAGQRTFSGPVAAPLPDAFACAENQLVELEYALVLVDSIGGLLQGHRAITGIREAARRGASAATEIVTIGLAGGTLRRYDELTVFLYQRPYPQGNTIEATAGMLTITDQAPERRKPTDAARRDARQLIQACGSSI
jgi:hypothetical protein